MFRGIPEVLRWTSRFLQSPDKVIMTVTDRGKGLPAEILEKSAQDFLGSLGVGLRGMNERLKQIGGSFEISSDKSGTQLRATVPLKKLDSTPAD